MNERIRELQSKSYLMCKQIVDDDGHVVVTPDQWFDKFAELIVEECIKQAHNVANLRGVNDQMIYGADSAAVLISKLFKD